MFFNFAVFVLLGFGMILCLKAWGNWLPNPLVDPGSVEAGSPVHNSGEAKRLFVLIHGYRATPNRWKSAKIALEPYGDVLVLKHPSFLLSNADPEEIAKGISNAINAHERPYQEIILVGHSMGALITRSAFLHGCGIYPQGQDHGASDWTKKVTRIVLLAGMNRGWDIDSKKPMDMTWWRYHLTSWSTWFGETTGIASLPRAIQAGSPFVANLRLEWMRHFRTHDKALKPLTVQLLGDIDDTVSDEDNKDLAGTTSITSSKFLFLRVRGTDHSGITDFTDPTSYSSEESLGAYRQKKFLLAAVKPLEEIQQQSEVQSFGVDSSVKQLIFVIHGIRDSGNWSRISNVAVASAVKHVHSPNDT